MQLENRSKSQRVMFLVSGSRFEYESRKFVILTLEDVTELVELRGIIPICMHCRKVRDDENYWQRVEDYFRKHSKIRFTHGICPDCKKEHYPFLDD